ncbi:hypothetical protein ACFXHK_46425, partial [Embleya sp. NPDC059267]
MSTLEGTAPIMADIAGASGNEPTIFVAGLILLAAGALLALAGRRRFADDADDADDGYDEAPAEVAEVSTARPA